MAERMDLITANKKVLVDRISKVKSLVQTDNSGVGISVEILSGIQSGSLISWRGNDITLGSNPDCSIVLVDQKIRDEHLRLEVSRTILGLAISLTDETGPVTILNESEGDASLHLLPVDLELDGTLIRITRYRSNLTSNRLAEPNGQPKSNFKSRTGFLLPALVGSISVFLFFLALIVGGQTGLDDKSRLITLMEPTAIKREDKSSAEAINFLNTEIQSAISDSTIDIASRADGVLRVSGRVLGRDWSKWQEIREKFDSEFNQILQSNVIKSNQPISFPPIAMVRVSFPQQIIMADETILTVGDPVLEGWKIHEIGAESITISDDTQYAVIRFQ